MKQNNPSKRSDSQQDFRTRRRVQTNSNNEIEDCMIKGQRKRKLVKLSEEGSSASVEEDESEEYNNDTDQNDDYCWKCMEKNGQLLCCDSCFRSFHMSCIGLKKQPTGLWACPQCCNEKCDCPICDKQCFNEVVVCTKCNVGMHLECTLKEVPLEIILRSPVNRKYQNEILMQQLIGVGENLPKVKEILGNKTIFHCCLVCFKNFGLGSIITNQKLNDSQYYLVLLEGSSYIHCHFFNADSVISVNQRKFKNYKDKYETKNDQEQNSYVEEDVFEYLEPERIIGCKKGQSNHKKNWREIYAEVDQVQVERYGSRNNFKFLIKWSRMFYEEISWEDSYFIMEQHREEFKRFLRTKMLEETYGTPEYEVILKNFLKIPQSRTLLKRDKKQPIFIVGGLLHSFQIQGLEWLKKSYQTSNNVILADEMGLGKTIQTVSFLNCLQYENGKRGPFLVIGPATILYNWLKEIKRWADTMNVIVYTGNQESRDIIREREFYYQNTKSVCKFNILITSYDIAIIDQHIIKKIKWECLIVDEAHRLKNNDSKFFKVCSQFQSKHIILLTGTPLQNNILELINLIEFIAPNKAKLLKSKESLSLLFSTSQLDPLATISEETKKNTLAELNRLLEPHILRRTKTDVNLQIPEMEEIIIKLCLTDTQKFLYKNVLVRNYDKLKVLDQKTKGASKANLLNILMSLRLVCNHPYLFTYKREFPETETQELVNMSNKLKFIDRIIPRLLEMQHKMLIFSQFTMMLDLLQLYLTQRGWSYERLDGTTSIMDRQRIIDSFNNQTSKSMIFLLSTRAGGLGINLTSADTIIFTDSDFNPYRDLQAISRAHRMGQKNKVKVYRLVSKHTAEERIIAIATRKLLLEEIIINPINKFSKDDFSSIFKESTWELFNKNLEEKDQEFTDEQLNKLLNRDSEKAGEGAENLNLKKNDINDYYLSGFKFTSLNFESVQQEEASQNKLVLEKYWETFLDDEAKDIAEQELNEFGKGKRLKKNNIPNYQEDYLMHSSNPSEYSPSDRKDTGSDEQEQLQSNANSYHNDQEGGNNKDAAQLQGKREKKLKSLEKDHQIIRFFQQTVLDHSELAYHTEEDNKDLVIYGFTQLHRTEFLDFVLSFGMEFETLDLFQSAIMKEKPLTFSGEVRPTHDEFKKYLKEFYALLMNYDSIKTNIAFCSIDPKEIMYRISGLGLIKKQLKNCRKPEKFRFDSKHKTIRPENWSNQDDYQLCRLVIENGFNQIENFYEDPQYFHTEANIHPNWYKVFSKIESTPFENIDDEQLTKKYVNDLIRFTTYWLKNRCVQIMNVLLDNEE